MVDLEEMRKRIMDKLKISEKELDNIVYEGLVGGW